MAISETPEVLVAKGQNGELSPNPASFGFTKQHYCETLPTVGQGVPNTLYLVKVKNGDFVIGYRPYRFIPGKGYEIVSNPSIPNLKAEKGTSVQSKDAAIVINEPKEADPLAKVIKRVQDEDEANTYDEVIANVNKGIAEGDIHGIPEGVQVLDLTNHSSQLSDAEFALVVGNNCIIKKDNYFYYKMMINPLASPLYFYDSPHLAINQDTNALNVGKRIYIDNNSKQWHETDLMYDEVKYININSNYYGSPTEEMTNLVHGKAVYSVGDSVNYLTSAPSAANTSGRLKFVVLSSDPATKYDGYLYIIVPPAA